MGVSVNGVEIDDQAIERELPHHQQAADPRKQAMYELVLRSVALQEADRLGVAGADDEARIEALFEREVRVPEADEAACETFYRNQPQLFTRGEMVEARHILFQITPNVPHELVREKAQAVLDEVRADPVRFGELARQYSNCPSGALGGSLGQLTRGQTVPEFEEVVFRLGDGEIAERLLETRFGLHIVQVHKRIDGIPVPYESVKAKIAENLKRQAWQRGVHQYLRVLVGRADIQGIALEGADSPLVQ
jgi:peptidyl-prolyl cis-trans isomerase C